MGILAGQGISITNSIPVGNITGLGTGVATALAINVGSPGAFLTTSSGAANVTVGTSTITSGTTTRILYDNLGVLGEYTISGTGTTVAMTASPTFTGTVNTADISASGITILSNKLSQSGDYAYLGVFAASGTYPTSTGSGLGGLAVGWNFSAGAAEVNLWNTFNSGGGFNFQQKTGASSVTTLASLSGTGAFVTTGTIKTATVGGYLSSDNSAGISTTITTGSLVGKTITVKDGLITGFA